MDFSLSLIQSLKPLSKCPPYSSLNPSTSMIFPSYLCSSISLSVYVFYIFISFSSQLCLYFGLPGPLSQGLPPFPFLVSLYTLSGFLPSSLPPVSLLCFSFIPGFLCSLLVPAISRRKISDVPNGLIRRIKQHSTNTMEMSDRKL